MNIAITGTNRGIGLELTRQYLARGDSVFAGIRKPERSGELTELAKTFGGQLRVIACDVASDASVRSFAADINEPIDILVNNAGIKTPGDTLAGLNFENAAKTYQVNTLGVLRVSLALLPVLKRSKHPKIANISSGLGSIADSNGGIYEYRMSKAALNMASRTLALDLRKDGIIVVAISPGWVKTDMGGPGAPTPVAESAAGLIRVIDKVTLAESGEFMSYEGERRAW